MWNVTIFTSSFQSFLPQKFSAQFKILLFSKAVNNAGRSDSYQSFSHKGLFSFFLQMQPKLFLYMILLQIHYLILYNEQPGPINPTYVPLIHKKCHLCGFKEDWSGKWMTFEWVNSFFKTENQIQAVLIKHVNAFTIWSSATCIFNQYSCFWDVMHIYIL